MRIFLSESDPLFRLELKIALEQNTNMTLVGDAGNASDTVNKILKDPPDAVVFDLNYPDAGVVDIVRLINKILPGIKIVALSNYGDDKGVDAVMTAGADGCISKTLDLITMVRFIELIASGRQQAISVGQS